MNTKHFNTLTAGIAAALIAPAFAIEAPEDNAPPPATEAREAEKMPDAEADRNLEGVAFLGVHAMEVPEMLSEHLNLDEGGVIVRALEPKGPAHDAGIEVNDVITRVAGKKVASSQDLTNEIKTHKPGEKVSLDVIHKGRKSNVEVTLGKRPDEIAGIKARPLEQLNFDGIPKEMADRLRGMIEGNVGGIELDAGELHAMPPMNEAMREMRKRMERVMPGIQIPEMQGGAGGIQTQQSATIRMMDDQGSVELKTHNDSKEVTVRDKDNKITWTGPWDTEQDKAAAPDDVKKRVDRLNIDTTFKGNGLRLRMAPRIDMAPDPE